MASTTKPSGIPWLGEVPAHWEVKRLKHVSSIRYGVGVTLEYVEEGLQFVRATDVFRGKIRTEEMKLVNPEDVPWSRNPGLHVGEIIVVRSGAYTGDSAIIPQELEGSIAGYDMVATATKAHPEFIAYSLLSKYILEAQLHLATMRAAQPHLNSEELGNIIVILPPLPEQRAIAAFLDERTARIDGLLARKQRLVQLLKEKRQSLITRAVTRGLDATVRLKESGVPWLGVVPEHWEVKRVKQLASLVTKGTTPTAEGGGFTEDGEIRFIKVESIGDRMNIIDEMCARIDHAMNATLSRSQLQELDVLVSIAGAIGRIGLVPNSILPANTNQAVGIVRVDAIIALPEWVALALQSQPSQEQFVLDNVQSAQANLSLTDLGNTWLVLPSIEEQSNTLRAVHTTLDRLDALITKVEQALLRLQEYRTALISAAVTGKVRVGGATPIP